MNRLVSPNLERTHRDLKRALGPSPDITFRAFTCGFRGVRRGLLVYIGGLADGPQVQAFVSAALQNTNPPFAQPQASADPALDFMHTVARTADIRSTQTIQDLLDGILAGETAFCLEGGAHALLVDTRWNVGRNVEEPQTEAEVQGPRDGNVEDIRSNIVLLRRRIRDPRLRCRPLTIGSRSKTDVVIAYLKGVANPKVVREVRQRLSRIRTDSVLSSHALDEFIQDNPFSPFAVLRNSERPDRLAAAIHEGRVVILCDNTPFGMIVPTTFWENLSASGDYYQHFLVASGFRWIRFMAVVLALALPSVYIMLVTFHYEMIPTPLALSIAGGHEGTPLPALVEVLLMEILFEVIQEAGLRLPRAVGQTVSIVGALVIGEAAVQAGFISPATVIVIASAGITGFAVPVYGISLAVRLARFPLLLLSGTLGVFGFLAGTAALALHLASLRSFGVPFLDPIAPLAIPAQKDTLVRAPVWAAIRRPGAPAGNGPGRSAPGPRQRPPKGGGNP